MTKYDTRDCRCTMPAPDIEADSREADDEDATDGSPEREALRAAFLAGFTMGRTGTWHGHIPGISLRTADRKFTEYYQFTVQ